jgi:hypothetical protein
MKLCQGKVKTQVLLNLKNQEKNQKKTELVLLKKVNKKIKFKNMNRVLKILRRNFQTYKIQVQF